MKKEPWENTIELIQSLIGDFLTREGQTYIENEFYKGTDVEVRLYDKKYNTSKQASDFVEEYQGNVTTGDQVNQGEWTTVTNPTVTYNWDHGDSNTSTNTVTVDAGSSALDGNDTDVKCTVTYKGKTAYCTFTLKHYGKSVQFEGKLVCSENKTITAFDPQTYYTTATASGYKVTATSGSSTQDWTSTYKPIQNATSKMLTAVQGSNGYSTGDASFEYTLKSPSISNVNVTNTLDLKHKVHLYCYGKSYYNR